MADGDNQGGGLYYVYAIVGLMIVVGLISVSFPDTAVASIVIIVLSLIFLTIFRNLTDETEFITTIFLVALALRLGFGFFLHFADLRDFFGGDANTYDYFGSVLQDSWWGRANVSARDLAMASRTSGPGWGMQYLVAAIYAVVGRNILAAQSFCAVIGAATAPMVFFCTKRMYNNLYAAKVAAVFIAVFPALVIWSSQLLKDGLIIFLLVLAITMTLELQEKMSFWPIVLLGLSLAGILSLRFYIVYMVVIAIVGSFMIGVSNSAQSVFARVGALAVLGIVLTYAGLTGIATDDMSKYADLQTLQNGRLDQARTGESGFAADADVSTADGALTVLPVGFAYLMFAPFPWEVKNLRQAIPLPEVFIWWAMMPLLVAGLAYSIRHRLRTALPIILFSLMLTLAYSISQGNVGTAYRQRTQIQVFLFIFIAVGWSLRKEKREDQKLIRTQQRQRGDAALRARQEANT